MDWTRGRVLGRGSTATVSIAADNRSGQVLAVKSAELSQSEFLVREQRILSTLTACPQVVAYKGCHISSENGHLFYNLFLEYVPGGTLLDAIRNSGGRLDEEAVRWFSRSILLGLEHLHSSGIVHCDIKSQNILVTDEGAKIADFGCSRCGGKLASDDRRISGTPIYMAPEVARGEQQSFPADVWALGCTVLEMATGCAPWPDVSDPVSAVYRVGFSNVVPEIPGFVSEQGKDFLGKCLNRDPEKRWSATELLGHEFVKESEIFQKEIKFSGSQTPNCVLNQRFWNSMEGVEFETSGNPIREISLFDDSAKERIKKLRTNNPTSSSELPSWDCGENWVTVRSNSNLEMETGNLLRDQSTSGCVWVETSDMSEEYEFDIFYFTTSDVSGVTLLLIKCDRKLSSPCRNFEQLNDKLLLSFSHFGPICFILKLKVKIIFSVKHDFIMFSLI